MAYSQYLTLSNMVVKKNGTVLYEGPLIFQLLSNTPLTNLINKMNSNDNFDSTSLYTWSDGGGTWADFTSMVGNPFIAPYVKPEWIASQLTTAGDEIWYYNKDKGDSDAFVIRSKNPATTSVYIGHRINGTYRMDTVNEYTLWQVLSNRILKCYFGFIIDRDSYSAMTYIIQGRDGSMSGGTCIMSLIVAPFYTRANYNLYRTSIFNEVSQIPTPPPSGDDPYADGGYSTSTDTGTGTFDDSSESVALPTTYAYSATAAGLISQYVVTEAELRTFGAWLWYGGSIIDDLKHFFQSPMEAIFSVGMLPFTPSDTTDYNIYVGSLDANTTGKLVNDTVEKISMGSITFDGYYGSALDFNPYTKIEIFLPYCGNFALNPDEVMGHTISVDYYCDSVSGDCVAFVSDEDRVLYQVKGNCFVQIPLAARDFTAQYASAIGAVGTVAAGLAASVASGGMSAPIAVGMGTSMASNAMNAKTHIARAGGVSGMAGFMSIQNPYVIITIPNQCLPEFQAEHQGYPLFVTKALKEFSGFTKVYEIHLDGLDCTDAEAKEIYDLLKGGVIL